MQGDWASSEPHSGTGGLQFFRDDFQHEGCEHPDIRIFLCTSDSSADLLGKLVIDSSHLDQAFKISLDECGRPLPHVIARPEAKYVWRCGANHKAILREQSR